MRFIGGKVQQVLLLRCSEQRGPGTASAPLYIGSLWAFPAASCIFHPGVGMPDTTPALSGPTCWEAASIF